LFNICVSRFRQHCDLLIRFNTGMPLLKVLQPDTLREDGLIYYTEMDRQEY
jgi:hypothetical protein